LSQNLIVRSVGGCESTTPIIGSAYRSVGWFLEHSLGPLERLHLLAYLPKTTRRCGRTHHDTEPRLSLQRLSALGGGSSFAPNYCRPLSKKPNATPSSSSVWILSSQVCRRDRGWSKLPATASRSRMPLRPRLPVMLQLLRVSPDPSFRERLPDAQPSGPARSLKECHILPRRR